MQSLTFTQSPKLSGGGAIYEAIPKIMAELKAVGKNQVNQAQRFKFRGIDDIYNACQKTMAEHGVFSVPSIKNRERFKMENAKGSSGWHVVNHFNFRFFASDGSYVDVEADGEAMDYGDKASNKAASIAHKYALLQIFCIPTEDLDDPDSESPEGKRVEAPKQQQQKPNGFDINNIAHVKVVEAALEKRKIEVQYHAKIMQHMQGRTFDQLDQVINDHM